MIVVLIVGLHKTFRNFEKNINFKVDLSNYATKTDINI